MVFGDANDFVEFLRGALPIYAIFFLPILIILSPLDPVLGVHEFAVYRVQQYDLHGTAFGCRAAAVNVEARTLSSRVYTRRGVLARITELTLTKYHEIVSQIAGALVIMFPPDFNSFSAAEVQHVLELEKSILEEETVVPLYFTEETPELLQIYRSVENAAGTNSIESPTDAILNSVSANGFQLVVSSHQPKPLNDVHVATVWGKLLGHGIEEQLPSIVIVAHYDAFGAAPALSYGADSNGSGVVALLELARLFSRLYSSPATHAKYNIIFMLSGAGKFNYQGTKKWIEDSLEATEGGLLQDAVFTLCLDTLGSGDELYMHVSKPPKEGTSSDVFLRELKQLSERADPPVKFDMVHKKINLADDLLAWEHERFSIRRLPAFTLSRFPSPKLARRNTMLDTRKNVDLQSLLRNVKLIADALARQIYNLSHGDTTEIFTHSLSVQKDFMRAWLDCITSQPRGAQLFLENGRNGLVATMEHILLKYLKDVRISHVKPDKRDPEFVFYDSAVATMSAYSVKPALFDLFVCAGVAAYLGVMFVVIQQFSWIISAVRTVTRKMKVT